MFPLSLCGLLPPYVRNSIDFFISCVQNGVGYGLIRFSPEWERNSLCFRIVLDMYADLPEKGRKSVC
jgi:hypothetical protein